ncbi:MAG TPA: hypothetical protein PK375_02935 [Rhodocyclaceae bacterium]|nr:hypothetical protein [Rhodocyclaceae bacterium]HNH34840.1 hypothetical protein [Rhodocyclaceae bacterium]
MNRLQRRLATLAALAAAGLMLAQDAAARNLSFSAGGGVKCRYVLVSSVAGVNTWQTVCSKTGV